MVQRELANQIQSTSGILVAVFNDCKRLEDQLARSGFMLSAHTLARFFGVLKSPHKPYTATLNLLAEYVGYASYQHFKRAFREQSKYLLEHPDCAFETGAFSITALELCLHTGDMDSVGSLLDAWIVQEDQEAFVVHMRTMLGYAARVNPQRQRLLQVLAGSENGRLLYYEGFVDEDDESALFSTALEQWYARNADGWTNKLFTACFLSNQRLYKGLQPDLWCLDVLRQAMSDISTLHYHLVSRCYEMQILLEGTQQNRRAVVDEWVSDAIQSMQSRSELEQSWVLARMLRALAHTGNLHWALRRTDLRDQVLLAYSQINPGLMLNNSMIVQFIVHALMPRQQCDVRPPYAGFKPNISETNLRVALESATASLYSKGFTQHIIQKNLAPFLSKTNNTWISKVLNPS